MERIARFVYRRAKLIIAIVIVINIAALASLFRFNLNTDFLSSFTQGNPKAEEFNQLNEKYESGAAISVLIEHDDSLLSEENLIGIFRLQEEIKTIDGISVVQSFIPPEILIQGNIISIDEALISSSHQTLSDFIANRYFLTDQFLTPDRQKGIIMTSLELDAEARDVIQTLKETVQSEERLSISLAGDEIIKDTLSNYLMRIIFILPPSAVILILLVFFAVLRNRKFTILSLIPAGFAALWTLGTIFWSGQDLNVATVISPIFIIVIGSAYGLHFVSHFSDNLHRYSDRQQLVVETMRMVGTPIFLATITTMAGFASLTWTEVTPMRHMGIFVTLGISYAGFMALFFLPAVLSRIELPSRLPESRESRPSRFILAASRHKVLIVLAFVAIVGVSGFYIPKIEVVSNQLMFFREGSEIRQTFNKIEKYFGGALPLTGEIISDKGRTALGDHEFASKALATERELEKLPGIGGAFSIFDLLQGANKMATGQDVYPQDPALANALLMQLRGQSLQSWVSDDGFRMIIRTKALHSGDIGAIEDFVAENQDTIRVITGMPVLFDEMNKLVVQSQTQSLGLALALIFIMLWATLRSIRAALAGLLPIAITITAILGMLSITGINLNVYTATLSAIAIGVGVDYSIHLISGIHYFRREGLDRKESVTSTLSSVSRPVLANALGLAIGLSALYFSPLRIHPHIASVMWVAMMVSSMAALLLVPIFYSIGSGRKPEAAS